METMRKRFRKRCVQEIYLMWKICREEGRKEKPPNPLETRGYKKRYSNAEFGEVDEETHPMPLFDRGEKEKGIV